LTLPEAILKLIPPRPPEYYGYGELMPKRMGMNLDALAAAEALANYELAFLFNPQRANRLIQNKAIANTLGLDDVLDKIIAKTWKMPLQAGLKGQVQLQTQQMVLTHLLALSRSDNANYMTKSICHTRLKEIQAYCRKNNVGANSSHYLYALDRIDRQDKGDTTPLPQHREMPPGAPIGCDD
jgi:hypothetical protein